MTTQTIARLFDTYADAATVVAKLEAAGFNHDDISIVANNADTAHTVEGDAGPAGAGATAGTMIGGGLGLAAGLGALAIPGVGPVIAAGWLVATLTGAGVGAVVGSGAGGLIGSLTHGGVSEDDAHVYAEGVRRGGSLVTVRTDAARVPQAEAILNATTYVDPIGRRAEYQQAGWTRFDESAPPYTIGGTPETVLTQTTTAHRSTPLAYMSREWFSLDIAHDAPPGLPHFDGARFFNPGPGAAATSRRGLLPILRWRLQGERPAWPDSVPNGVFPRPHAPEPGHAAITFIGHASFLIQFGGLNILTDPVFSERASPVGWAGPRRVRAPGLVLHDLPRIDLILISHNHYDHCDLPSLRALAAAHAPDAVTLLGNAPLMAKAGLRTRELDWFETADIRGLRITATPARHFSRRTLRDGNRALWGGFMLRAGDRRILFAGDSGMGEHWTDIAAELGPPDVALLPIGAYEPRWIMAAVHMNPEEAVRAHLALGARQSIGMHFGTFRLTDEAIDAPVEDLARLRGAGVGTFGVLQVGETKDVLFEKEPKTFAHLAYVGG